MTSCNKTAPSSASSPSHQTIKKCKTVSLESNFFQYPEEAPTLVMSSLFRIKPQSLSAEISQPLDPVAKANSGPTCHNPEFGSPEWISYTCHQMDISSVTPYRRQVAGHGPHSRNDPIGKSTWIHWVQSDVRIICAFNIR